MAHTFSQYYSHLVWSTKNRFPLITEQIQERLYPYIVKTVEDHKGKVLALNGMSDHVHLLISHKVTLSISELMRDLKSATSKFIRTAYADSDLRLFSWQEGYGAFSIGQSTLEAAIKYVQNQQEHHQKFTFEQEYLEFLKRNKIQYDPRFVFD